MVAPHAPVSTEEPRRRFNRGYTHLRTNFMATTTIFEEEIKDLKEPIEAS